MLQTGVFFSIAVLPFLFCYFSFANFLGISMYKQIFKVWMDLNRHLMMMMMKY